MKDELRREYKRKDFKIGVRSKYYKEHKSGHNLVLLDPEVAKVFPDEKSVNEALLSLIKVAQSSIGLEKGSN